MAANRQLPLEQQLAELSQEIACLRELLAASSTVRRPGRPEGEAWERAEIALQVIQELNQLLPAERQWAVNQTLLNGRLGVKREVAKAFLSDRKAEIEAMNSLLPLPVHRQNFGHDFEGLRERFEKRLEERRIEQSQADIPAELMQDFLSLLEWSKNTPQLRDPKAALILRQLREARRMSQKSLGQEINQTQSVIAALENGTRTISPKMLLKYAKWVNSPTAKNFLNSSKH